MLSGTDSFFLTRERPTGAMFRMGRTSGHGSRIRQRIVRRLGPRGLATRWQPAPSTNQAQDLGTIRWGSSRSPCHKLTSGRTGVDKTSGSRSVVGLARREERDRGGWERHLPGVIGNAPPSVENAHRRRQLPCCAWSVTVTSPTRRASPDRDSRCAVRSWKGRDRFQASSIKKKLRGIVVEWSAAEGNGLKPL